MKSNCSEYLILQALRLKSHANIRARFFNVLSTYTKSLTSCFLAEICFLQQKTVRNFPS